MWLCAAGRYMLMSQLSKQPNKIVVPLWGPCHYELNEGIFRLQWAECEILRAELLLVQWQ